MSKTDKKKSPFSRLGSFIHDYRKESIPSGGLVLEEALTDADPQRTIKELEEQNTALQATNTKLVLEKRKLSKQVEELSKLSEYSSTIRHYQIRVDELEEEGKQLAFNLRVLDAVAFDNCEMIWWRTDSEYASITFFVNCNDLFWWATADAEKVTPENIHLLKKSFEDIAAIDDCSQWGGELFCCRSRKMRPQGAAYPKDERLWSLFDECGPDRDVDEEPFGNPKKHPSKRRGNDKGGDAG